MGLFQVFLTGCASPGQPLPPTLNLPSVVTDLAAGRSGDKVTLRWTTPSKTTEKLNVAGEITAEVCRQGPGTLPPTARPAEIAQPCSPVERVPVKPGASQVVDALPSSLTVQAPGLLEYRVQLRNAAGRTAGPSAAVFVPSGTAPPPVEELRGTATRAGALIEWKAEEAGAGAAVELTRIAVGQPEPVGRGSEQAAGNSSDPARVAAGRSKTPVPDELRLRAGGTEGRQAGAGGLADSRGGPADPGGAIDRTAATGRTYRYTAERVRVETVGGHTLEVRSAPSASVTVLMSPIFPPDPPAGLVASPGVSESGGQATDLSIDLSWEPGIEPRIAGYRVYRRTGRGGAWQRLGDGLVKLPGYRDPTVAAGQRYAYRVTAVDTNGNESGPSGEIVETAPRP